MNEADCCYLAKELSRQTFLMSWAITSNNFVFCQPLLDKKLSNFSLEFFSRQANFLSSKAEYAT